MPAQFEYSGVDRSGQPTKGLVEGESPISVVLQLKKNGVRVYSIKKKSEIARPPFRAGVKAGASDLILFNTQLASLLKTKLPLADSLRHLSNEFRGTRFRAILGDAATQVESGRNLSESLALHEGFFPPLYLSMVEAGEKSGNLAEVLFQASQYLKSVADFKRKFLYILFYPAVLCIIALGVLVFLLKIMVPPYIDMYSGFHVDFPPSLKLLVALEEFFRINAFWTISVPAGLVAVIALALAIRRNESMRMLFDRFLLKIPLWGEMVREVVLASSFSMLTVLLRSGVPLYESLKVARDLISNRPLRMAFELGAQEVLEGQSFSVALVKQPLFPLEVAWVVRNGEARGDLIGALDKARHTCQRKFEFTSQIILSVLEPALLIMIGAIIVSITISLFYPLYSLSTRFGI